MDRSVHELRDAFFRLLDRGESAASPLWHEVWKLFLEHPWYQAELHEATKRLVGRGQAPADMAEDIEHDALILLSQHLRRAAHLHVNRELAEDHFTGWLARIVARDCSKALRAIRRAQRRAGSQQVAVEDIATRDLPMDEIIDLSLAISKLPDEWRRVLLLRLRGCGIAEIARRLRLSQTQVHRALQRGLSEVKRRG